MGWSVLPLVGAQASKQRLSPGLQAVFLHLGTGLGSPAPRPWNLLPVAPCRVSLAITEGHRSGEESLTPQVQACRLALCCSVTSGFTSSPTTFPLIRGPGKRRQKGLRPPLGPHRPSFNELLNPSALPEHPGASQLPVGKVSPGC
jgi:hypothetical protein